MKDHSSPDSKPSNETGRERSVSSPPEPHLLDAGNLPEIAQWIAVFVSGGAVSGVIGNAAYDLLKNIKRRHGREKICDLESKTLELIEEECQKSGLDEKAMKSKVQELFEDYR